MVFFQLENVEAKRRNFSLFMTKRCIRRLEYLFLILLITYQVFKHKIYILLHITVFIISKILILFLTDFDYRRFRLFYRFSSIAKN